MSAVGPLLPQLALQTGSTLAAVGAFFTVLSFGQVVSQVVGGPASDRLGPRPAILVGLALVALGVEGIGISNSLLTFLGSTLVAGLGYGAADIGINLLIASAFARRRVSALNLLHLFWGLGATIGPAAVGLSFSLWSSGTPALWPAVFLPAFLLPITYRLRPGLAARAPASSSSAEPVYRSPLLWALAGMLAVSVGIEIGTGGWTTSYLMATTEASFEMAALVTSGYWMALSAGRVISTLLGTRVGPRVILGLDVAGACAASMGMIAGLGNWPLSVAATLTMGLSIGSMYPTTVALVTAAFKSGPGRAASVVMASTNVTSMTLPWLQGLLFIGLGPASSTWFVASCSVIMLVLYACSQALQARSRPREGALRER